MSRYVLIIIMCFCFSSNVRSHDSTTALDFQKRFAKGYLAYAGGGRDSRGNQFIVALEDNGPLAGGSPWEVPWGELVSTESFETLGKIYTGYDEKGPPQGELGRLGMTPSMKEQFPLLDYIQSCVLVDEAPSEDMSSESVSRD